MRDTKLKKLLMQVMENSEVPISVPDIIQALELLKVNINKTTIYRELEAFKQQGLVKELDFGEGKKRYEFNSLEHHHHLICTECNCVQHIELDDIELSLNKSQQKIYDQLNFQVTDHSLELFGLCEGCQS